MRGIADGVLAKSGAGSSTDKPVTTRSVIPLCWAVVDLGFFTFFSNLGVTPKLPSPCNMCLAIPNRCIQKYPA